MITWPLHPVQGPTSVWRGGPGVCSGPPGPQPPALVTLVFPRSDGDAEDGEQGPIWTFPPTIRPSPHSKLHKGSALHGPQKVWPPHAELSGGLLEPAGKGCGGGTPLGLVLSYPDRLRSSRRRKMGRGQGHLLLSSPRRGPAFAVC